MHDFSFIIFCLTVPKNLVGEPFCAVFQKSLWIRGGGVSRYSIENFLSHSAEDFRRGESFSVSLISGMEIVWIRGRGGEYQDFPSKIFCLTEPKNSVGQTFSVSLISGTEKVWIREGGGVSRFSVENFLSHSAEKFRRGILYCCNNFGYQKSLDKGGGGYHDFPSKFLSHCTEIFHWRTLWCFRKNVLSKIFIHRRGGITVLSELFVSKDRNEKLCKGTLLFSGNFLVSKKNYG